MRNLCDNCAPDGEPNVDELSNDESDGRPLQVDEGQEDADHDVGEHRAHASAENYSTHLESIFANTRLVNCLVITKKIRRIICLKTVRVFLRNLGARAQKL